MNEKFKHIQIKYACQCRLLMADGDIMTTTNFQSQLALMPIAVPLLLAWRGRISGYT